MTVPKEGQTLFHRILLATAGGLTSTTSVDWHLKVKDIEYNVGLTKNYCITVNMQKISSIHTLFLKIQQILVSRELKKWPRPFFDHTQSKISEIALSFPDILFAPACKKSVHSIHSFLR